MARLRWSTRWTIRLGTLCCLVAAGLAAARADTGRPPAAALGDPWVLRAEVFAVTGAVLTATLIVTFYGLVRGRLPSRISRDGLEYRVSEVEEIVAEATAGVRDQAASTTELVATHSRLIEELAARLAATEAGARGR